eukprot:5711647-Amphidinium_carterae.2
MPSPCVGVRRALDQAKMYSAGTCHFGGWGGCRRSSVPSRRPAACLSVEGGLSICQELGEEGFHPVINGLALLVSLLPQVEASELTQQGYTHVRKVRGDGNCFYRATFIGW